MNVNESSNPPNRGNYCSGNLSRPLERWPAPPQRAVLGFPCDSSPAGLERSRHERFLSKEGPNTTPEETWERMQGFRGIRAMYRNAGVMLEMVDYAARNDDSSGSIDRILLETLRSDAMQIRIGALRVLAHCAFNQASESVRSNAFQVASMYTGMAARMAQLLEVSAPDVLPDFVAAM